MPRWIAPIGVVLFSAGLAAQQAQTPQEQAPTFRVTNETVPIYATVKDQAGRLVPGLTKDDFKVFDDGQLQTLTVFKNEVTPFTVVIMLDTSGSMTANIERLKDAAEQFVIRMLPADRARIGSFNDKIDISPTFTSDRDALIGILHNDIDFGNPTRLWDACDTAMTALAPEQGRRVVLVFTDGYDEYSQTASYDEVLKRAEAQGFMIYAIGFQSVLPQGRTKPDPGLKKLANETGGGYFELKDSADLGTTFERVVEELHSQYDLGFSPTSLDGKMHKLEILVTQPGMTVQARKSYLAAPAK